MDDNRDNKLPTDKMRKEIESTSSAILDNLSFLFPKERTSTVQEKRQDTSYAQEEIMDLTKSPQEKITTAVHAAKKYAILARDHCASENISRALTCITESKFYFGIAFGIKSTIDDGTDYGTIQQGTIRAKERARLGGVKKEENQKTRRRTIINILLATQPTKPWRSPREAAEKIASRAHKELHDKNIPLTNIDALENLIIKLINNDEEAYKAYNSHAARLTPNNQDPTA